MTRKAYQELLWHLLLRGVDTFFMWCPKNEAPEEIALVHEVWREALAYRAWLEEGTPVTFAVPAQQGAIVSGLRRGKRVLVRRTDVGDQAPAIVRLAVGDRTLTIPNDPGCADPAVGGQCLD